MPALVVVIGLCCLRWSLHCSSNRDLFLTVTVVVRRKCCTLHMHALLAVTINTFNKRREERKHARSISAQTKNRSGQSSQPTLLFLVSPLCVPLTLVRRASGDTTHVLGASSLLTQVAATYPLWY